MYIINNKNVKRSHVLDPDSFSTSDIKTPINDFNTIYRDIDANGGGSLGGQPLDGDSGDSGGSEDDLGSLLGTTGGGDDDSNYYQPTITASDIFDRLSAKQYFDLMSYPPSVLEELFRGDRYNRKSVVISKSNYKGGIKPLPSNRVYITPILVKPILAPVPTPLPGPSTVVNVSVLQAGLLLFTNKREI